MARPTFFLEVGSIGGVGGAIYIYNLEEVPVSGRKRFNIISPVLEEQIAEGRYKQMKQNHNGRILPESDNRVKQIRKVLDSLIPSSGMADKDWTVDVIDSEETNAFVIPGRHVFVFTGILPVCQTEDGLATVLGHEIGHAVANHIAEGMTRSFVLLAAALCLELVAGLDGSISRLLLSLVFERPHSRMQESEADYLGLMMMSQSCHDPAEAIEFWRRMQEAEKDRPITPQYLSTHPSSHSREAKLKDW